MPLAGILIDTNLFLLLVVGGTDKDIVAKHKRLRSRTFTIEDYDTLVDILNRAQRVLITPHTLAETSNLLDQHADPERTHLFEQLRFLIHGSKEVSVSGKRASNSSVFTKFGLTDAALLEIATVNTPLLTTDADLYQVVLDKKGPRSAQNFMHYREL